MRAILVAGAVISLGCQTAPSGVPDAAVDHGPPMIDLTGRIASQLMLQVSAGGGPPSALPLLAVWPAVQRADLEVDATWILCDLQTPGLPEVQLKELQLDMPITKTGKLDGTVDGAHFTQPEVAVVIGARLANRATDPLPTDGKVICSANVTAGCAVADAITHKPGVALKVSGYTPDIEFLYLDLRVKFAFDGTATFAGTLDGNVSSAAIEAHVLDCTLRTGVDCTPADIAKLEASHPSLSVKSGAIRSHVQGSYFNCPQFLGDPEGSVTGVELPDGGTADANGADFMLKGAGFATGVQGDLDAFGCATGGCHERIDGPGKLHLIYQPNGAAEVRQNYQAVLPWLSGGAPGGRFVNEAPLPSEMRSRWLQWIAAGAPY